jgi:hypothetical protein
VTGTTWRCRLLEGGVEAQTGDEGDRLPELAAAIQELEGGIPTVPPSATATGDGHDLALGAPASYQQQELAGSFG